jgi:hypothetical protein
MPLPEGFHPNAVLDVSVAEDQIQGHVCDGVREPRQFCGWLGLIGELDGMLGSGATEKGFAEEEAR